ncbi:MAG TPA: FAD-dependent monooxygenase [Steroidobacteraceae bacterium]|nr:FAD-dependent monooxygenase [Steroidobacteraceae bacterium]
MPDIEVPVLIVGGSLVGMTAALLLGRHGVRPLVVEHHRGTAIHPRAASVTQRTMEIFRGVGLEQTVRVKSEAQFVQDAGVVAVETLAGGATAHYIANFNDGIRDVSPTVRVFLSQNVLEPTLKECAEQHGARIVFATECLSFEQDADGVTARIRHRDTGETQTVRAQYLIAADGAHSRIRTALGVRMRGHGTFSKSVTIYFRANLRTFLEGRLWAVVYANHPRLRGFFRFEKPFDSAFLVVNTLGDPSRPDVDVSTSLTTDGALELVRTAIGSADLPITIENVMHWQATADTAERFRKGRVFIAGDAAHVMPPTGGWGGNAGIQDAHNLAWKLALVVKGVAGPELLSTYEDERRPIDELTVEQAYTRYVLRTDPSIPKDHMQPIVGDLNVELGYVYHSHAIIAESPTDSSLHLNPRETRAFPGTRMPHYWLQRAGRELSTLDLIGGHFTLLGAADATAWCQSAARVAGQLGIELDVFRIGQDGLQDPTDAFAPAYGLEPSGCVLIRPDGFVAWRARSGAGASAERFREVLTALLCLDVAHDRTA